MTVTSQHIHNVLRTYGKQLRRGFRLQRMKSAESTPGPDKVKISSEAKRMQVIERVASEIIMRLADPGTKNREVELQIVETLSQEYGQPLELHFNEKEGIFNFDVLDADKKVIIQNIKGYEAQDLQNRLVEITKETINRTMI